MMNQYPLEKETEEDCWVTNFPGCVGDKTAVISR